MLHSQSPQSSADKLREALEVKLKALPDGDIPMDAEQSLYSFECAIDALDRISDSLVDDPITANALNGLHTSLCSIHSDFKSRLMPDME